MQNAKNQGFIPFTKMNDLESIYTSPTLFPQFANRVLAKSRPEYERYQKWIILDSSSTPLEELANNNGVKVTDNIEL